MSIGEDISESIPVESDIEEDIEESYSKKVISEYITQNLQSGTLDAQTRFLHKKILALKRKSRLLDIPVKPKSFKMPQVFSEQIKKLKKNADETKEEISAFYRQPASEYLVSKLRYMNAMSDIQKDAEFDILTEENLKLKEEYKVVERQKFITAQYYRLLAKNT